MSFELSAVTDHSKQSQPIDVDALWSAALAGADPDSAAERLRPKQSLSRLFSHAAVAATAIISGTTLDKPLKSIMVVRDERGMITTTRCARTP